ncbi:MAG: DUF4178 domain-containing protein [Pirellulales bacterium]
MKRTEAPCPACGAPVEFKASSSLVTICTHCESVVARGDQKLEDLGKVAALVDTLTPLDLGVRGVYDGKSFELVGRTQYRHASGAVWDEWYIAFANGAWGWLAEAQGRFFLTVRRRPKDASVLPAFESLTAGQNLQIGAPPPFTVNEAGVAQLIGAEGELPFRPDFAAAHRYADLSGPDGRFATLDYGESPPKLFLGQSVTLEQIGISPKVVDVEKQVKTIAALVVACPHCGGSLELRAPDRTERVVCPYCRAELDANQGELRYMKTLSKSKIHPFLPIGGTGTLRGESYTVIGFLQRSVMIERVKYYWTEYLLFHERDGFRWLVDSNGHWNFVRPVSPGEVQTFGSSAKYDGRSFKLYQRCPARVEYVLGEFFWKVSAGEMAMVSDYIAPPFMLSAELSLSSHGGGAGQAQEINYSFGEYIPRGEISQAFNVPSLPMAWGVAPNQPHPVDRRVYALFVVFVLLLLGLDGLMSLIRPSGSVDHAWLGWLIAALALVPGVAFMYGRGVEQKRWEDSYIEYPTG